MRKQLTLTMAVVASAIALGLAAAACGDDDNNNGKAPAEVQLTQADNGKSVNVSNGGTLIVALTSNPSTGYAWSVVSPEPKNLELDGQPKYVPPGSTTPVVGAPGTEVFTFKAVEKGTSTLKMEYRRSFEPNEPAQETFSVEVQVK